MRRRRRVARGYRSDEERAYGISGRAIARRSAGSRNHVPQRLSGPTRYIADTAGCPMLTLITELGAETDFDSDTVRILSVAFDHAWASVKASGAPFSTEDYAENAREIIGKCIIAAAKAGERDIRTLADGALLRLATSDLKKLKTQTRGDSGPHLSGASSAEHRRAHDELCELGILGCQRNQKQTCTL
jgi:hypothetical protein